MVRLVGRILNCCQDVITLKIGIVLQNLLVRRPGAQELQNVCNANSHAPNAGATAAFPRLNGDSFQKVGLHRISTLPLKQAPDKPAMRLLKRFARGGDRIVRATSDHELLSVYAARRADGTLALLVINKSPGATLKAGISIAGFQPESGATSYSSIPGEAADSQAGWMAGGIVSIARGSDALHSTGETGLRR